MYMYMCMTTYILKQDMFIKTWINKNEQTTVRNMYEYIHVMYVCGHIYIWVCSPPSQDPRLPWPSGALSLSLRVLARQTTTTLTPTRYHSNHHIPPLPLPLSLPRSLPLSRPLSLPLPTPRGSANSVLSKFHRRHFSGEGRTCLFVETVFKADNTPAVDTLQNSLVW